MSSAGMYWAMRNAPEPSGDLHHGHGSIYRPIAKLLLIKLGDIADTDYPGPVQGRVNGFRSLCEALWLTPDMGTMVVDQMVRDGLIEISYVIRGEEPDEFHQGVLLHFQFTLVGAW